MPADMQLPQEAARVWTDPAQRERIVAMHGDGTALEDMCDELGLGPMLDRDGLRDVLRSLGADEVQAIRDAFLAEAAATPGPGASFPVDCRVDDHRRGVRILSREALEGAVGPIVRVEQA